MAGTLVTTMGGVDGNVDAARRGVVPGPTRAMVWGRAGVLGTVAFGTGAVSHALAGGLVPGPLTTLLVLTTCVPLAAAFLLRRASAVRLVVLVLAGQTYVHTLLSALGGHRGDPAGSGAYAVAPVRATGSGSLYDQFAATATPSGAGGDDWFTHQLAHLTEQSPWMVLAHTLGAVALALFLAVGEDALWRWVALAVARTHVARTHVARARAAWAHVVVGVSRGVVLRSAVLAPLAVQVPGPQLLGRPVDRHRGPPFLLAA